MSPFEDQALVLAQTLLSAKGLPYHMDIHLTSPSVIRRIAFLVGPLMGGLLIAWAAWVGVGPGLALLCVLGALILIVVAPIGQYILLKTQAYQGRYLRACLMVISVSLGFLVIATFSGVFNFW